MQHRVTKVLLTFLFSMSIEAHLSAAPTAWQPSAGHTQIAIWPDKPPDARVLDGAEDALIAHDAAGNDHLVGGRAWTYVQNVSQPTITVYSPQVKNTGAAVIVFPG